MNQRSRVLNRLRQGSLTAVEALSELSVGRLAARIEELRAQGHEIITEQVEAINAFGDDCRYGRYRLIREIK